MTYQFLINTETASMQQLKEYVDFDSLSQKQLFVASLILNYNHSRVSVANKWNDYFHETLSMQAVSACIKRIAQSLYWTKGMAGGSDFYLCPADIETLTENVIEHARHDKAYDSNSIIEEAHQLKVQRQKKIINALELLKAPKYAQSFAEKTIKAPSRQWLNSFLPKINCKLFAPLFLDSQRFWSCREDVIDAFYEKFGALISSTPLSLIFVADETMVQTTRRNKVVIPSETETYFEEKEPEMPHITGFCVNNIRGDKPPLFLVLKGLKRLPQELQDLVNRRKIWVSSSKNGWMNREIFLFWCICFIGWLNEYRTNLDPLIADKPCVLILDGHNSRQNPLAMELLAQNRVRVIVLPAHTTHVLQVFDVGLAGVLKKLFTDIFTSLLRNPENIIPGNQAATLRYVAVEAFCEAWDLTCCTTKVRAASTKVGIVPNYRMGTVSIDVSKPKTNKWVKQRLTQEEQRVLAQREANSRSRLNISCEEITNNEVIEGVRGVLSITAPNTLPVKRIDDFGSIGELVSYVIRGSSDNNSILGVQQVLAGRNLSELI